MKYIYIILGILIIGGGIYLSTTTKEEVNKDDINKEEQVIDKEELSKVNSFTLLPEVSSIKWSGKKTVLKNWIDEGSIQAQDANIVLSEDDSTILSGNISVNMKSIVASKTGSGKGEEMLVKHLSSADFFDVEKYGIAKFEIKNSKLEEDKSINLSGDLTIKDITKPYEFKLNLVSNSDTEKILKGVINIDRTDFDVKFGSGKFFKSLGDKLIDDKFTLDINLVFSKDLVNTDDSKENSSTTNSN